MDKRCIFAMIFIVLAPAVFGTSLSPYSPLAHPEAYLDSVRTQSPDFNSFLSQYQLQNVSGWCYDTRGVEEVTNCSSLELMMVFSHQGNIANYSVTMSVLMENGKLKRDIFGQLADFVKNVEGLEVTQQFVKFSGVRIAQVRDLGVTYETSAPDVCDKNACLMLAVAPSYEAGTYRWRLTVPYDSNFPVEEVKLFQSLEFYPILKQNGTDQFFVLNCLSPNNGQAIYACEPQRGLVEKQKDEIIYHVPNPDLTRIGEFVSNKACSVEVAGQYYDVALDRKLLGLRYDWTYPFAFLQKVGANNTNFDFILNLDVVKEYMQQHPGGALQTKWTDARSPLQVTLLPQTQLQNGDVSSTLALDCSNAPSPILSIKNETYTAPEWTRAQVSAPANGSSLFSTILFIAVVLLGIIIFYIVKKREKQQVTHSWQNRLIWMNFILLAISFLVIYGAQHSLITTDWIGALGVYAVLISILLTLFTIPIGLIWSIVSFLKSQEKKRTGVRLIISIVLALLFYLFLYFLKSYYFGEPPGPL